MATPTANPVTWTWPNPGEDVPPYSVEGNFGPVSLNDSIVLTFTPASYSGIFILYCGWQNGEQGITWTIYNNKGSPFTYTFNETTPDGTDTNDLHICHFLQPTNSGNTQTFQYLNTPAKQPILWQESGPSVIVPSSSSASASKTSAGRGSSATAVAAAVSGSSTSASSGATSSSTSHTLTVGAAVGITVGIVALLVILGTLAFFLRRRSRRRRQEGTPAPLPIEQNFHDSAQGPLMAQYPPKNMGDANPTGQDYYGGGGAGPLPQKGHSMRRMGELDGQAARSEMDGSAASRARPGYPSELSGQGMAELPAE